MNRIILIGNGFDLAHGLKTSYADFINWYWSQRGRQLLSSHSKMEDDGLCSFGIKESADVPSIGYVWGYRYRRVNPFEPWDERDIVETAKQDDEIFKFEYKNQFFADICNSIESKGWVDIENIFYNYLSHKSTYFIDAKETNDELDIIRGYLITYLSYIQESVMDNIVKTDVLNKIMAPFKKADISLEGLNNEEIAIQVNVVKDNYFPDRLMMLNFNYTNIADKYFENTGFAVNHIHGSLSNPDSVIFGYGDELDENYKTILNKNDNEYLRNIKSIKYLEASNYRQLLEFIESDVYQIYIMGHSCGNSDRTLLNTLFEHKNCVSIKPFYHEKSDGTDNYIELVQNISRNFKDMKLMRDRVVNKTFCEPLSKYNPMEQSYYYYTDCIMNLRQAIINGEVIVAKPVLLLALIDGIGQGIFKENRFVLNEWLDARYLKLMVENTRHSQFDKPADIANPFWHLATDGFWHLNGKDVLEMKTTPSRKWLKENINYAYFDEDLWILLQNQPWREKLRNFIVEQKLTNL